MTGANSVLLRRTRRGEHVGGLQVGPLESRTQLEQPVQLREEVCVPLLSAQLQTAYGAHLRDGSSGGCRLESTNQAQATRNRAQTRHAQAGQGRVMGGMVVRQRMRVGHMVVRRHRRGHGRGSHVVAVVVAMGVGVSVRMWVGQRVRMRVGVRVGVVVRRGGGQVAGHRDGHAAGRRADGRVAGGAG